MIILHLFYYIQPFTCSINNNNHNHNNNHNENINENENENDLPNIFNLHKLYFYLQYICYSFTKLKYSFFGLLENVINNIFTCCTSKNNLLYYSWISI